MNQFPNFFEELNKEMELTSDEVSIVDRCHADNVNADEVPTEKELDEQISTDNSSQTESPWNIAIVDNLPHHINKNELISIFSQYGVIENADIVMRPRCFARFTYRTETAAQRLWVASKTSPIMYHGNIMTITVVSEDYCPIANLPYDCLLKIFTHLTEAEDKLVLESVSKKWREISKHSWRTFRALKPAHDAKTIVPRAKKYLRKLYLSIEDDEEEALEIIATNCTNIETISMNFSCSNFEKKQSSLNKLFRRNKQLRYISWCFERMYIKNAIKLDYVSSKLEYLRCMSFDVSPQLEITMNISKLRNLKVLILHEARIEGADLKKIFENMINLKKLKFYNSLTGSELEGIVELTKLEHLSLYDANLTDSILEKVLRNNKKLKYLNIARNEKITDASFKYVKQLPELQVLIMQDLLRVTDKYFTDMPSAKLINVNGCPMINDEVIDRFLKTAFNLQRLEVQDTLVTLQSYFSFVACTERTGKKLEVTVSNYLEDLYTNLGVSHHKLSIVGSDEFEMDVRERVYYEMWCEETFKMLEEEEE